MKCFFTTEHEAHAPAHEFYRGERVPCFEGPARATVVLEALLERGHEVTAPDRDCDALLARVHSPRYLAFLRSAWDQWVAIDPANSAVQPFPSVWPVRTLRSDLEPDNFTARLGLYSMDNGTPLVAGTWQAVKAAADAAASAAVFVGNGARSAFCATRPPGHHAGADVTRQRVCVVVEPIALRGRAHPAVVRMALRAPGAEDRLDVGQEAHGS